MSTGELPKGWAQTHLVDVLDINPRDDLSKVPDDTLVSFVPMQAVEALSGKLDPSRMRPAGELKRGYTQFRDGDVLLAKITPCMENGKFAIAENLKNGRGFGSTEFHVVRCPKGISNRFVFYYALRSSFRNTAAHNMKGTAGQKRVPTDWLEQVELPIPPTAEQERIVAKIDELFARLDAAETEIKRAKIVLDAQRRSVLNAAFCGALTKACRIARTLSPARELLEQILDRRKVYWSAAYPGRSYKEPFSPVISDLPDLPDNWCWVSVDQIASGRRSCITDGPFGSNLKTEHYTPAGPRVVRLENIGESVFNDSPAHISVPHFRRLGRHEVFHGDVLIASLGAELPRACLVPKTLGPAIVKADCVRLQPSELLSRPEWVMFALNSPMVRKFAKRFIHGVGRPRLSLKFIRQIPIPLAPQDEQTEILDRLGKQLIHIEAMGRDLVAQIAHVQSLKQSILTAAFSGELVPQNAGDESAEKLLERIRAQGIVESPSARAQNGRRRVRA